MNYKLKTYHCSKCYSNLRFFRFRFPDHTVIWHYIVIQKPIPFLHLISNILQKSEIQSWSTVLLHSYMYWDQKLDPQIWNVIVIQRYMVIRNSISNWNSINLKFFIIQNYIDQENLIINWKYKVNWDLNVGLIQRWHMNNYNKMFWSPFIRMQKYP